MDAPLIPSDCEVVFEVPTRGAAATLFHRLAPARMTWQVGADGIWLVGTQFDEGDDLAVLLRDVERYVAIGGLRALRYWLDGRDYILESGDVPWPALALTFV